MTNKFQLSGAERFSQYLEEKLVGVLTAEGPQIIDRSYTGEYGKRWVVRQSGEQIGEYFTFGPESGETDFCREFRGRIPGYKNELAAMMNQRKPDAERMPEDSVSLTYSNQRFEAQSIHEGPGKLVDTPWQRQDGHDKIPFP